MKINYSDDFLTEEEHNIVYQHCLCAGYRYGELDRHNDILPTGMVSEVLDNSPVYNILKESIFNKAKRLIENKNLYRMYVNCFAPIERPHFHPDGPEGNITFLYYPNLEWDLDEGGETQFLVDGNIYGVVPIPNRMVIFDASILHCATTFRNYHRFTVAIKYANK